MSLSTSSPGHFGTGTFRSRSFWFLVILVTCHFGHGSFRSWNILVPVVSTPRHFHPRSFWNPRTHDCMHAHAGIFVVREL